MRALSMLVISLCVITASGSCRRAPAETAGVITLRFWNGFTGPDGRTMLALVKRFNEQNPDVRVIMQRMEWPTYYNKLFVASLGNRAPEVFVIHSDNVSRFHGADFLRPMDDLTGAGGIDAGDFDANVWSAVERDGKHLGIPLDIHLIGMYYNRALFRKAGIDGPPRTREQFVDALRRLTRDENGDGRKDTWGMAFTWLRTNSYTLMRQWGGNVLDPQTGEVTVDSPQCVAAMQFAVDLIEREKVITPPENMSTFGGAFIGFRQGRLGLVFEGIYMLPEVQKQKDLDFAGAAIPQMGAQPAAWGSSHVLCLKKELGGAELEAGKRFVKFLSDNSLDWAAGGQIPVRKSLRETEQFRAMTAQFEFAKQIPHAAYFPPSPYLNEILAEFDPAVERILRRSLTPQQSLSQLATKLREILARRKRES